MATTAGKLETVYQEALIIYVVSMARAVERNVNKALDALACRDYSVATALASDIFTLDPRINEMEIVIDEYAVRLLRAGQLSDDEVRLIVATLKITNDLERMGDLAVNIGERVISLAQMAPTKPPTDLEPMAGAVRAMVSKSLGALLYRNVVLATEVLESDDVVDRYRDRIFERLLADMTEDPVQVAADFQFVLATRYMERIADHATNIAEDTIFWLRGLDVRHGRGRATAAKSPSVVTENS